MSAAMTSFWPGDLRGFVSESTIALVATNDDVTMTVVGRAVAGGCSLDAVQNELFGQAPGESPSLAMAQFDDDGVRVIASGGVGAQVRTRDGREHFVGAAETSEWEELHVPDPATVTLRPAPGPVGEPRYHVLAGVVPASGLTRVVAAEGSWPASDATWPPPSNAVGHSHLPDPAGEVAEERSFDHLFGHTVSRRVEDAAVRSSNPLPPDWGGLPDALEDRPRQQHGVRGDHDGLTVSRRSRGSAADAGRSDPIGQGNPIVTAILCAHDHPNPVGTPVCRRCGAPTAPETQRQIARPPLGLLVFSSGERVPLDRPLLIGRNPRLAAGPHTELPRFVKLDLVGKGVSRTHAEIKVDGWDALLCDSGSANGTDVTMPGSPPRRLAPGESVRLVSGTRVDLGGDAQFTVEPPT